jgi:AcrR family transcriptional regulator
MSRKSSMTARTDGTRLQILTAAADTLAAGDSAFSLGKIAERAGLTRQAVYLHFRDRGDLLVCAVEELNRRVGLAELRRQFTDAEDTARAFEGLVRALVAHTARTLPAVRAVRRLLEEDEAARDAWSKRGGGRSADIRSVTNKLAREGLLRDGLSRGDAAALVEAVVSPDGIAELVARRGWSIARTSGELVRLASAAILR